MVLIISGTSSQSIDLDVLFVTSPYTFPGFPNFTKFRGLNLHNLVVIPQTIALNINHVVKVQADSEGCFVSIEEELETTTIRQSGSKKKFKR